MSNLWDRRAPAAHVESAGYPTFQWYNGLGVVMDGMDPLLSGGGFEFPVDQFKHLLDGKAPKLNWSHQKGKVSIPGYGFQRIDFCVVAYFMLWFTKDAYGNKTYYTDFQKDIPGCRSYINALGFVKQVDEAVGAPTPVVLTLNGYPAKFFHNASNKEPGVIQRFQKEVIEPANQIAFTKNNGQAVKFPRYAFYIPMAVGPREMRGGGEQSMVALLTSAWPTGIAEMEGEAAIETMAVPDQLFDYIAGAFYEEAQAWCKKQVASFLGGTAELAAPVEEPEEDTPSPAPAHKWAVEPPEYWGKPEFAVEWATGEWKACGLPIFTHPIEVGNSYKKVVDEVLKLAWGDKSKKEVQISIAKEIRSKWVAKILGKITVARVRGK